MTQTYAGFIDLLKSARSSRVVVAAFVVLLIAS